MPISSVRAISSGAIAAALSGTNFRLIQSVLATPAAPVVSAVGGSGNSYRYVYVAYGAGSTAKSAAMTNPVSGPAPGSLSASVYLTMTPPVVDGVNLYHVFRSSSNAPLTAGFIGTCAPGVEFRDTGIVATDDYLGPTSDTGSAGIYSTGPIVAARATESNFGHFQFGPYPHVVVMPDAGGTPSVLGALGVITSKDSNNNGIYLIGNGDSAIQLVFRSNANEYPLRPAAAAGGQGGIGYESFIAGSVQSWYCAARQEAGLLGNGATTVAGNFGKFQWGVADGNAYETASTGMKLAATNTAWPAGLLFVNGLNLDMFNTGFVNVEANSQPTDYEVMRGTWNSNVFELGPVAGGSGTLRSMLLKGASIDFDSLALTKASATGSAGFRLPHGAAPTSPVDGDFWTTTAGAFIRINGVTMTFTLT